MRPSSFADLLPMLVPMGLELDYRAGVGPVFGNPVRSAAAVERLAVPPAEEGTRYIAETIGRVLADLPDATCRSSASPAPLSPSRPYAIEGRGFAQTTCTSSE